MKKLSKKQKFSFLRKKYPEFIYRGYSYKISKKNLEIFFDFSIGNEIYFKPKIIIENINKAQIKRVGDSALNNLIFNLGLIESISYWKAVCPQKIIVEAGNLNKEQIKWWKNLIINGMGEYFYNNKIDFRKENFVEIQIPNVGSNLLIGARMQVSDDSQVGSSQRLEPTTDKKTNLYAKKLKLRTLIPIGGGKDSVVTLEIFRKNKENINCLGLNSTQAAKKIMKVGECNCPIIIKRKIDKKLLELNRQGFLNGHTPFSAYLAFLNILCAVIFDYKFIVLSNEKSSNEGNILYLGKEINHQYSKSFHFEKTFRNYSKKYLAKDAEYFSFLRPLYEIQIAKIFSNFPKYFPVFLSCNEADKTHSGTKKITGKWCCNCSKCLFTFVILYPFLNEEKIIKIFSENLFEKKNLLLIMQELIGEKKFKPFECVGTKKECLIAFYLSWKKARNANKKLPYLLKYFEKRILPKYKNLEKESIAGSQLDCEPNCTYN